MLWENSERVDSMEHYRDYWDNFSEYPYLYYCRRCIRNFNTKVRVKLCNKCLKDDIVELPGNTVNVPMSRLRTGKKRFSLDFLDRKLFKKEDVDAPKKLDIKESLDIFSKKWNDFVGRLKKNEKKETDNAPRENKLDLSLFSRKSQEELPSNEYTERFKDTTEKPNV